MSGVGKKLYTELEKCTRQRTASTMTATFRFACSVPPNYLGTSSCNKTAMTKFEVDTDRKIGPSLIVMPWPAQGVSEKGSSSMKILTAGGRTTAVLFIRHISAIVVAVADVSRRDTARVSTCKLVFATRCRGPTWSACIHEQTVYL